MSQQAIDGFNEAARRWSANFTDNITVTINTNFTKLDDGILGSTTYEQRAMTYQSGMVNLRSKLIGDAKSAEDQIAISSLPNTGFSGIGFLINHTTTNDGETYFDNNGSANNRSFQIAYANARAIGVLVSPGTVDNPDAKISFSSSHSWDFDPSDGIASGSIDFLGVAMHEIGHVLGFSTEVDVLEGNVTKLEDGTVVYNPVSEDTYTYLTTLDLFRYSNSSTFGTVRDISDENTRTKYFSIDGGATSIANFSNGDHFGDGYQASHWKAGQNLGLMNPYLNYGMTGTITENDLMAMDVIGYDRNFNWAWDGAAEGNWNKAWNWKTYCVPNNANITANFATTGVNPTVTLNISPVIKALAISSDNVRLEMSNQAMTASEVRIGDAVGKSAGLTLNGQGQLYAENIHVGGTSSGAAGTGALTLGSGSAVFVSDTLKIHASSSNVVSISEGGQLMALNVVNHGVFDANAGQLSVNGSFTNAGVATLGGTQIWAPGAVLTNTGTLVLNSNLGVSGDKPSLVLADGTASFNSSQYLSGLSLTGGNSKIISISALSVDQFSASGGTLDLYQGGLIVNYSSESAYSAINAAILSGFLATTYEKDSPITEAAFDNAFVHLDSWMGEPLQGYSQILTQYAYIGDVNLDGVVSELDLMGVLGNMNHAGTWLDGDVNHDGFVNLADYTLVQAYIGAGETTPMLSMRQWSELPVSQLMVMVPEPGALGLGALGAILALKRRRFV